jgi:hypothetical protein
LSQAGEHRLPHQPHQLRAAGSEVAQAVLACAGRERVVHGGRPLAEKTLVFVRLRTRLLESDPGWLRFSQAFKTVVAVAIAVALFSGSSRIGALFAGISAAFLMQCVDTGDRRRQQISMAATAAAILIVAPIGSALHGHLAAEAYLMIGWAAAVFYARRFLVGNGAFTLYSFTEVLLATALPGNPKLQFITAAVGFGLAFPLRFYVWPPDEGRAFRDALRIFCSTVSRIAAEPASAESARLLNTLRETANFNRTLLAYHPELADSERGRFVERQYETLQSLRMMNQAATFPTSAGENPCADVRSAVIELASCRLYQAFPELQHEAALPAERRQ